MGIIFDISLTPDILESVSIIPKLFGKHLISYI